MTVAPRALPCIAAIALIASACGASATADQSTKVAAAANARSCNDSGYYVQSKLNGDKSVIYNCTMLNDNVRCVTYEGGIASDSTETVKLLWANVLSGAKPDCIS
jgi:hypothetical protein